MSEREARLKPLLLTIVAGANQRVRDTELDPKDYSEVVGVFPEFAGLQSRVWGKRLLEKYASSVYGIHQFWTPQGYGGGLYQFTWTLDYGYWLTPTSAFDLALPPLGIDLGNMTLDEFGNSYGSNFGYGTDNACVISFLDGGTDHSACLDELSGMGTPNDSNGGPAGQGKHCQIQDVIEEHDLSEFASLQEQGNIVENLEPLDVRNCRAGFGPPCVEYPILPIDLSPVGPVTVYASVAITGNVTASSLAQSNSIFTPPDHPVCSNNVKVVQHNERLNTKLTIDFSALVADGITSVDLVVERTPGGTSEEPIGFGAGPFILDANDYLELGDRTSFGLFGWEQTGSVTISSFKIHRRARVCA